jgi:hypothetical protein
VEQRPRAQSDLRLKTSEYFWKDERENPMGRAPFNQKL